MRAIVLWWTLLAMGIIGACGNPDSLDSVLADYRQRVENATGVESPGQGQVTLSTYPSHRDRTLATADIRVGTGDFLKLYDCDIFRLVNNRNSVLGKVMPVSQRLVYEVDFLRSAETCHDRLMTETTANDEFLAAFRAIIRQKRANLPKTVWNATFDSPEMQKAFSLAVAPWSPLEQAAYTSSYESIEYLRNIAGQLPDPTPALDLDELENQYYNLQLHRFGGALLQSIGLLTDHLNSAAHSLEQAIVNQPICHRNTPDSNARILENIFTKYYIGRVQPQLSQVHQQGKTWLTAINGLIDRQQVQTPAAFDRYRADMLSLDSETSLWGRFRQAIARHTRAWRSLLGQCGLMPGENPVL